MKRDLALAVSAAALVALGGSVAAMAMTSGGAHKPSSPAVRQVDQRTSSAPTSVAATTSAATSRPAATRTHTVVRHKRSKHHAVTSTRIVQAKEPAVTDPTSTEPPADPTSTRPAEPADTASGTETTVKLGAGTSEGPGVWRAPTGPKLSQPPHSNPPQLPNPNSPSPTPTPTP